MSRRELSILLEDQRQWMRTLGDLDELSPIIYEERLRSGRRQNAELRVRWQNSGRIGGQRSTRPRENNVRHRSQSPQQLTRERSQTMRRQPMLHSALSERMIAERPGQNPIAGPSRFLPNPISAPSQPIPNPSPGPSQPLPNPSPGQNLSAGHWAQLFMRLPFRYVTESENKESCRICIVDYENGERVTVLPCRHVFHPHCISEWIQISPSCPLCRRPSFQQRTWINMCHIL